MSKGWFLESTRHSMSAKGLSTGRKTNTKTSKWKKRREEFLKINRAEQNQNMATNTKINNTQKYETYPIDEAIRRNQNAGRHWFDTDTKRFFNSRWDDRLYKKGDQGYFISSERYKNGFNGESEPRKYSLRVINWNTGDVSTSGEFQAYNTKKQARKELRKILES